MMRTALLNMLGVAVLCLAAACGDPSGPALGAVEVSVDWTGGDPDLDGFTITVGERARTLGVGGSVIFGMLDPGRYDVRIGGVAENCAAGVTSRTVEVVANDTVSTSFPITCTARLGAVEVAVETRGEDTDPDGYRAVIAEDTATVAANGTVVMEGVAEGRAQVTLVGIADNCAIDGSPSRAVDVAFADTTRAEFSVSCEPRLGAITIAVTTTGEDVPEDGYRVAVDASIEPVGVNGTVTVTGLEAGSHSTELLDVPGNCSVEGANPRTVEVEFGATTEVPLSVTCVPRRGAVRVTVSTTGQERDPDGYRVVVAGDTAAVSVNGSMTFQGVREGEAAVELIDVASNCVVQGENPRAVEVVYDGTTEAEIAVACHIRLIAFNSDRSGNLDIFVVDPRGGGATRLTSSPRLDRYPVWSPDGQRLAFYSDRDNNLEIYVMASDGSGATNISAHPSDDWLPSWTPDNRILFTSRRAGSAEIYSMDPDGSNVRRLTNSPGSFDGYAVGSPDGESIAFVSNRDGRYHIYVMTSTGQEPRRLTSGTGDRFFPAWSPDGTKILFSSDATGGGDIYVMDADGGNVTRLTSNPGDDTTPTWSFDGQRIAFASNRDGDYEIFLMDPDGSSVDKLTGNSDFDAFPDWRP